MLLVLFLAMRGRGGFVSTLIPKQKHVRAKKPQQIYSVKPQDTAAHCSSCRQLEAKLLGNL